MYHPHDVIIKLCFIGNYWPLSCFNKSMIVSFLLAYSQSSRTPKLFKFCSSESCFDLLSITFAGLLPWPEGAVLLLRGWDSLWSGFFLEEPPPTLWNIELLHGGSSVLEYSPLDTSSAQIRNCKIVNLEPYLDLRLSKLCPYYLHVFLGRGGSSSDSSSDNVCCFLLLILPSTRPSHQSVITALHLVHICPHFL